jgi:hypothetical protein
VILLASWRLGEESVMGFTNNQFLGLLLNNFCSLEVLEKCCLLVCQRDDPKFSANCSKGQSIVSGNDQRVLALS